MKRYRQTRICKEERMTSDKPIGIEAIGFEEEPLPSGRKLLHLILKRKFGDSYYRWTPSWKGDYGVERPFFKALETEEWNDYDGVWSRELKRVSKEIPSLEEIRLPMRIKVGEMVGPTKMKKEADDDTYKVAIEFLTDEKRVWRDIEAGRPLICLGELKLPLASFKKALFSIPMVKGMSTDVDVLTDWVENRPGHGDWESIGISFHVWVNAGEAKEKYQTLGKQISNNIRSFVRKCLSDHQAIGKGFEEA
jgi:hypothetical protein